MAKGVKTLSQYWFMAAKNEGEKESNRESFDSNLDSFQAEQCSLLNTEHVNENHYSFPGIN